jgi:hypothetical protein
MLDSSSHDPIFPALEIVELSPEYLKALVVFLEVNTPRQALQLSAECYHPFTAVLSRLCKNRSLTIRTDESGVWEERHFKDVVQSRMWKIDTRINIPVTRRIELSTIDKAWNRVATVGNFLGC